MKKNYIALAVLLSVVLSAGSGCTSYTSNDLTHQPITCVKPVQFKPIFEVGERKIAGTGTAGGFFNFDFSSPSFSIPGLGASNSSAYVEPSLFDGLSATEAEALRDAIYNACKVNKAEYLLMPHFEIRTKKFPILNFIWSKSYCVISGLPAKVKEVEIVEIPEEKAKVDIAVSASATEAK